MLIAASCFIIRTLNREQIIFFPCRKAIKIRVHFLNLFNIITMQIIGVSMTIFAMCKTFLSNTPAFTDGKSILPQWAVISLYVLQLKGVFLLFRNSCSSVSFHFSISLCCWLSQELLDWAEKRVIFPLFLSLSQMEKSRCAYVPSLTSFPSAVQLEHLLGSLKGFSL